MTSTLGGCRSGAEWKLRTSPGFAAGGVAGLLVGAAVTLTNVGTNFSYTSTTGSNGGYQFKSIDYGYYRVSVAKDGFKAGVVAADPAEVSAPYPYFQRSAKDSVPRLASLPFVERWVVTVVAVLAWCPSAGPSVRAREEGLGLYCHFLA